jgi:adenine-specific DNA-methyltransferase
MNEKKIKVAEAKGRPMLNWVGKKPLDFIKSFPAQLVETFNPSGKPEQIQNPSYENIKDKWQNLLFHGDNKEVLGFLLANGFRGQVDLVYIDPPFDSGANYVRKVELRGTKEKAPLDGEDLSLGEQIQYFDIWANDSYLQWMYERLTLLKELLSEKGVIFVHVDYRRAHFIRAILDELFGPDNFVNEIIWKRTFSHGDTGQGALHLGRLHDIILFYSKSEKITLNDICTPYSEEYIKNFYKYVDKDGRRYRLVTMTAPGGAAKGNPYFEFMGVKRYWMYSKKNMEKFLKNGEIVQTKKGTVPQRKRYLDEGKGVPLQDIWTDINPVQGSSNEITGYPTQKPEALLERVIKLASNQDNLVLDCFIGSGTTAAVAQRLGRRWIGVDINKGAIQTTSKRLQGIISEQFKEKKENSKYNSFSIYNVNDYDLQLLRTEAIELAIQHIGIVRTKTDLFFEGTLGKNLVKIIDFNHPLTLLDLQLIQDELKKRPDENRNITIVCLGKELSVDAFIEDYNKKHPVNKLEIIELRTDKKYGKFLIYKKPEAKVDIKRKGEKALVEIENFISPSIIERLNDPERLVKVKIPDFRSMIDVVLIDTDYNNKVFNVVLSDVPKRKKDLIEGKYEVSIPKKKTKIAVKIIDMLGEEVLITKEV